MQSRGPDTDTWGVAVGGSFSEVQLGTGLSGSRG